MLNFILYWLLNYYIGACIFLLPSFRDQYQNLIAHSLETMQVILVGHDFGGACLSYAMELFPFKIAKAIFYGCSNVDKWTKYS